MPELWKRNTRRSIYTDPPTEESNRGMPELRLCGSGVRSENMAINDRLKPVAELLETNRQKIELMISYGMASDLAIQKRKKELYDEVMKAKEKAFKDELADLEGEIRKIEDSYREPKKDPTTKLLEFEQIKAKIRSTPSKELKKLTHKFQNTGAIPGIPWERPDHVDVLIAELRNRGLDEEADLTWDYAYNKLKVDRPWENNPLYKQLKSQHNKVSVLAGFKDMLKYLDGTNNAVYISETLKYKGG